LAGKEFLDVKRLYNDLLRAADEEEPPPTPIMG